MRFPTHDHQSAWCLQFWFMELLVELQIACPHIRNLIKVLAIPWHTGQIIHPLFIAGGWVVAASQSQSTVDPDVYFDRFHGQLKKLLQLDRDRDGRRRRARTTRSHCVQVPRKSLRRARFTRSCARTRGNLQRILMSKETRLSSSPHQHRRCGTVAFPAKLFLPFRPPPLDVQFSNFNGQKIFFLQILEFTQLNGTRLTTDLRII